MCARFDAVFEGGNTCTIVLTVEQSSFAPLKKRALRK